MGIYPKKEHNNLKIRPGTAPFFIFCLTAGFLLL